TRPVDHPYRWDDVLRDYRERLLDWGGTTYALPVTGEGMVLAYRKDAFDGKDGRPSTLPVTWDGLLETARTLNRQFGKCLPPVPRRSGPARCGDRCRGGLLRPPGRRPADRGGAAGGFLRLPVRPDQGGQGPASSDGAGIHPRREFVPRDGIASY